jgi:hypothetical protein
VVSTVIFTHLRYGSAASWPHFRLSRIANESGSNRRSFDAGSSVPFAKVVKVVYGRVKTDARRHFSASGRI